MSLPIPIIAGNFEKFHKTQAKKNKLLKRRAAVALAREKEERVRLTKSVNMKILQNLFRNDLLKSPVEKSCSLRERKRSHLL